jgi:peptide/nickel transport system substrate-binding protein
VRYFTDIVGAASCPTHPGHCDLSAGIQTDDAAGTVTFHLTRSDPDFLVKLASFEFAAAVPPGTPMHVPQTEPIPGTGPYKILTYVRGRHGQPSQLTLVRNPYFPQMHPWSLAAQPPGYVNEIRWVTQRSAKAAIAAVLAGRVDLTYPTKTEIQSLTTAQQTRQASIPPAPFTGFVVLNAKAPPFDDITARRAAATALTADPAIARIMGRRSGCKLDPPNYPGYSPGCAYRRNLAAAKHLVIKSRTAGEDVHVYVADGQPYIHLARHIRKVFQEIGYHASLRVEKNYRFGVYSRQRPVNAEPFQWGPDFFAASQFYEPLLGCQAGLLKQLVCNHSIDALASRALRAQVRTPSTAERLWERVYQRVDADARIIPTDHATGASVLLSTRTRNYSFDATNDGAPLLDQLWVK